jgi:hypothetical protein
MYYAETLTNPAERSRYDNRAQLEESFEMQPSDYVAIRQGKKIKKSTGITECLVYDPKAVRKLEAMQEDAPPHPVPPRMQPADRGLDDLAHGGARVASEIAWAIDLIRRGDTKTAINRLSRCLTQEDRATAKRIARGDAG